MTLSVKGALAGYRRRPIARLGSLAIGAGEAAVLIGPSGSGKTTLLLAIAGLDLLSGEIEIGGEMVSGLPARLRDRHRGRSIGMVFQDLHLATGLSALDNMLLSPFAVGVRPDRDKAAGLLDRLGLKERLHARAETLSRGEAQRVAIARAMLLGPQLILADEPTASLDDESCNVVLDHLLDATRTSGASLLVATHDSRVKARIPNIAIAEPA
jgi:putative ABC transport system ATP-binding protein